MPSGANTMHCHYVFDVKRKSNRAVEKFKARLVADGNTQKFGIDFDRIFSTVVKSSTASYILSLDTAFDNFGADENSLLHACEAAAHVFSVSMVSTSDLGEIPIPKGYKQATTGPRAKTGRTQPPRIDHRTRRWRRPIRWVLAQKRQSAGTATHHCFPNGQRRAHNHVGRELVAGGERAASD